MIFTPSVSENFFEYAFGVASMQLSPVMLSIAGILMLSAYKCACIDDRTNAVESKSKLPTLLEIQEKEAEEKKKAEMRAAEENARKEEVMQQIAEAIIRAQKEEKANQDAEEMSHIINAALKKLYIDNENATNQSNETKNEISNEKIK